MNGLDGKKEDEKEDEADARIAVLHMIADDKQGIYGDWEERGGGNEHDCRAYQRW